VSAGCAGPRRAAVAVMIAAATMGCAGDGVIDLLPGEAPPAASSASIASCSAAPPPKPPAPAPVMMPAKPAPAPDPPCDGAPCPKPAMPSCIPDADVEAIVVHHARADAFDVTGLTAGATRGSSAKCT
jgi:hypothetical protein